MSSSDESDSDAEFFKALQSDEEASNGNESSSSDSDKSDLTVLPYQDNEIEAATAMAEMAKGPTKKTRKQRKKQRSKHYMKQNRDLINLAHTMFWDERKTVTQIAEALDRPRTTIYGWIQKDKDEVGTPGRRGVLTYEEERLLVAHMMRVDDMGYGLTRDGIKQEVAALLKNDPKQRYKAWKKRIPSEYIFYTFSSKSVLQNGKSLLFLKSAQNFSLKWSLGNFWYFWYFW